MFYYKKRLIYPVHVDRPDPILAKVLFEDYQRELRSSIHYLNRRSNISNRYVKELLGLIAAEELGHMEIISVAINKLGGPPLISDNSQNALWEMNINQSLDAIAILQLDVEAEARASQRYHRHIEFTSDPHMKRLNKFLGNREEVHRRLLQKAQTLIYKIGSPDEFNELIYEYKVSLQILE